jgi:hypothetical protein
MIETRTGFIPRKPVGFMGILFGAITLACCLSISCSRKELPVLQSSQDDAVMSSRKLAGGPVFTVSPSGNYNDDSHNIQEALEAALAQSGSTVKLTEGTFYLKVRIEVTGFDGYLKGAGKDKTFLTTHDKVLMDLPWYETPALIKFRQGNINMSDLTISITDPEPCTSDPDGGDVFGLISVIMITGIDENPGTEGQFAKFNFNNLRFVGGNGTIVGPYNYNIILFIYASCESDNFASYPLTGGYKITNCEFTKSFVCIQTGFTDGPCIIGGDPGSGNKFDDTEVAVWTVDVNSSYCNTSWNSLKRIHWLGIADYQGWWVDPGLLPLTRFVISHNDIMQSRNIDQFTVGIDPVDYGPFSGSSSGQKMVAVVSDNSIKINDAGTAAILGESCNNLLVTNNIVKGTGYTGIAGGIWEETVNGWVIKGNNVQGMDAELARIWLGPGTSNCIVAGGSNETNVLDEGNGNILIGVTRLSGINPGQNISEAMHKKFEPLNMIRHQ